MFLTKIKKNGIVKKDNCIYMSIKYFKSLLNKVKRTFKVLLIETKLELRKIKKSIKALKIGIHLKKMYLLFLIVACMIPLFTIKPSAITDNRIMQFATNNQDIDNSPIYFSEPEKVIPNIENTVPSSDYQQYTLKENENLETLSARFSDIKKETLTINNQDKEFKNGTNIIIPTQNSYLIGYNKDSNFEEIAKALNKTQTEIINLKKDNSEGYLTILTDNPEQAKNDYQTSLIRLRTPTKIKNQILLTNNKPNQSQGVTIMNNSTSENFSGRLETFISNTKGILQHDGNGWSNGQCVSLVKRWQQHIGAKAGFWPGNYPAPAYYSYLNGNRSMAPDIPSYRVIVVTDVNSISAGDLLITTGSPSHTGIATGRVSGGTFDIYDQNSPAGSPPRFNKYPNRMFIGALRYIKK